MITHGSGTMAGTRLMTAEDVARLPDDDHRYDLIDGVLMRMPPAGAEHGELAYLIGWMLGNFILPRRLGRVFAAKTGFLLAQDPDVLLGPDVAYVAAEHLPSGPRTPRYLTVPPDLAVEVRSPSDRPGQVQTKVDAYLLHGVRLLWVVDPARQQATVYRPGRPPRVLDRDGALDGEDVLPGFTLPLRDLFERD
jgi:Uma2 family endonuclease